MSQASGNRLARFLTSAKTALALMLLLAGVSFAATLVPQQERGAAEISAWAAAHPAGETMATALGLHRAYTSWVFLIPAVLLFLSTVLCAWQRTMVARKRARMLRAASGTTLADAGAYVVRATGGSDEVLDRIAVAIDRAGVHARAGDGSLTASSAWLTPFASPVFHWALVGLMLLLALGQLSRADGLIGVPVGQSRPLVARSFGKLSEGPLHRWGEPPVLVAVSGLEPSYVTDGIDRGPTPTVALLAADGRRLVEQRVYPNAPIQGSGITVHASDYGLAVTFALRDRSGSLVGTSTALVDFSSAASSGVEPVEFALSDARDPQALTVNAEIPIDQGGSGQARRLPAAPTTEVRVTSTASGAQVARASMKPGEGLKMPDGSSLVLEGVSYYARLNVVEDPSIPWIYGMLAVALLALIIALLFPQRVLLVRVIGGDDGTEVEVFARMWRNAGATNADVRTAIETAAKEEGAI